MSNVHQFLSPEPASTLPVQVMLEMFDQPIHFHPWCARVTGSALAGLLLSMCLRKAQSLLDPNGWGFELSSKKDPSQAVRPEEAWFELNVKEVAESTGMSRHEQQAAKRALLSLQFLDSCKRGLPAVTLYRVNMPKLMRELESALSH